MKELTLNFDEENKKMTAELSGRIDANNAITLDTELNDYFEKKAPESVVIDLKYLEYVSSAGLRVFLKLQKKCRNLRLINASADVYEIFSVTGFSEIMNIEKALRDISIDGLDIISQGMMGEIYRLTDSEIVKIYKDTIPEEEISESRKKTRSAFVAGIPTMIPFDMVRAGNRLGVVYEMLGGESLCDFMIGSEENMETGIEKLAEVYHQLGDTHMKAGVLADHKDVVKNRLKDLEGIFTESEIETLKELADVIPATDTLVHGDLHCGNIIIKDGEITLIDMDDVDLGHPIWDLSILTFLFDIFANSAPEKVVKKALHFSPEQCRHILRNFISDYFKTGDDADIDFIISTLGRLGMFRRVFLIPVQPEENRSNKADEIRRDLLSVIDQEKESLNKVLDMFKSVGEISTF